MEQRRLGSNGPAVAALGFGCGSVGGLMVRGAPDEQRRAVARALAAGITYFDTAPSYGAGRSEENLGRVLRELDAWDRVVVGTKARLTRADLDDPAAAVRRSVEASLRRLGRDAVDLVQLHNRVELLQPTEGVALGLEEVIGPVAEGFKQLVRDGLCRWIGFTGLGDTVALREVVLAEDYQTVQAYFNVLNPSAGYRGAAGGGQDFAGLIDLAAARGLGVIVIRPFAGGALSAQPERHPTAGDPGPPLAAGAEYQRDLARAREIAALAAELGLEGPLELALRFVLAKPGVSTVLVGFSDLNQLESAIRWAERGPLPGEVVGRLVAAADAAGGGA